METKQPTDLFELPVITAEFVKNEIRKLSTNKATGNDELSVRLLKLVLDIPVVMDSVTFAICLNQLRIFLQRGRQPELSLFLSQAISSKAIVSRVAILVIQERCS